MGMANKINAFDYINDLTTDTISRETALILARATIKALDNADVATNENVNNKAAEVKNELKQDIAEVKNEITSIKIDIAGIKADIKVMESRLLLKMVYIVAGVFSVMGSVFLAIAKLIF